jgi:hypothetical protein
VLGSQWVSVTEGDSNLRATVELCWKALAHNANAVFPSWEQINSRPILTILNIRIMFSPLINLCDNMIKILFSKYI